MITYDWKPLAKTPSTFEDLKHTLINIRNLDQKLVDNTLTLKDLLKDPLSINFDKENLLLASETIKSAIDSKKGIIVHGDYDVDGITSTSILYESLLVLGFKKDQIKLFLPNRFEHGYGFSSKSYDFIKGNYSSEFFPVIILTDCGITAVETVKQAKKDGYKVILIDHHQKKLKLPKATAIFWNDKLTASVLTYFYSKYIELKLLGKTDIYRSLDFAGMGYISDLGNLSNKIGNLVTKEALELINSHPRESIKKILYVLKKETKVTAFDIGWLIGPRLNSMGRIGDPIDSLNFLLALSDLDELSYLLEQTNKDRQDLTKESFEEAINGISNKKFIGLDESHKISIVHSENFHEGVIGLISSKIVKSLYKPTICISWEGDVGKGSCRSIEGVNIVKILDQVGDLLEGYGGHEMAAGFTIRRSRYKDFENKIIEAALQISSDLLRPIHYYDCIIKPEYLGLDLLSFIDQLEPFGNGNPAPLFVLKNVRVENAKKIGSDETHISFNLKDSTLRAIFFGGAKYFNELAADQSFDILFSFEKNVWKGSIYPQLQVKDLRPSDL